MNSFSTTPPNRLVNLSLARMSTNSQDPGVLWTRKYTTIPMFYPTTFGGPNSEPYCQETP
eukprot:m.151792 g.151792  ORF g.151792 m.151792 type:complete len:60 (+) comp30779_c1_seq2:32-211(+)